MVGTSCNPLILLFQHDKPEISANNRGTLISTFKSLDRFDETDFAQDYPVTARRGSERCDFPLSSLDFSR